MKKQTLYIVALLLSFIGQDISAQPVFKGNQREKYNFNSSWLFQTGEIDGAEAPSFNDKAWKKVTLPRAYNEDDAFRLAIDEHTTGIVWYRKHFKLPSNAKDKKVFVEFEGIRFGGEVYINGKSVGIHENGVMAFGIDITDHVYKNGKENIIALKIDNAWNYKERATGSGYQWNDKNFNANYGGIPKNVYLHLTDKIYQTLPLYSNLQTTGVYVYAQEINTTKKSATIHAESEVRNEYGTDKTVQYEMTIEDMDGKIVKTIASVPTIIKAGETQTVSVADKLEDVHFWGWGYGYLYNVYTTLYMDGKPTDVVKTRTGFRKTAFGDGMVKLNDRVLQMKGYAQRTSNEWPSVGMSVPAWLSDYSNKLVTEGNGNFVRWMHVTPWKQDVESCDRVGLIQVMPAGDAEKDVEGRRWELRKDLMRDAIIYNRNNPSILFYECGNESISEAHMAEMIDIRNQYDPNGGRAIGSREMLDIDIAEWGGEMLYINKSAKHPMFATEYCRDEGLRKYWDDYSYPFHKDGDGSDAYRSTVTNTVQKKTDTRAYNRNQDSFAVETVRRWFDYFRVRPGTGKRVSSGGANIIFSDSNTHYRGVENYRRSGEVDAMRIPKDAFFAHQVMWDGWVDIENYRTHIVGHWNYEPSVKKDVFVVSSGEKVELFVNDKSKGFGKRDYNFLFTFKDIQWEAGTIKAVSYDANNKVLSSAEIQTAGEPAAIKLTMMQSPDGFKADGADLVLVQFEVVDSQGRRCPLANDLIDFELTGPAEWRGGLAQGEGNYILSQQLPVECGVNRALIRSTTQSGKIKLTAKGEKLATQTLEFQSIPFKEKDGLATYISAEHLPSNMDRGEVVGGASFKKSRESIKIVDAISAANRDKVRQSFDDNELSEWSNDGALSTGWITYELERDADISEIELKLTGWRMRSYPIKISIDDKVVFEGDTQTSLGYISIPVETTKGRFVKIELMGRSSDNDAFSQIVEITGQIELDLYKDPNAKDAKGQLRIVEVEFYEHVK